MRLGKVLVVAVALLVAVGVSFAAGEAKTAKGAVKSITADTLVITVAKHGETEAHDLTFTVTKDTTVVEGDAAKTIADVKVAGHVTVEFTVATVDAKEVRTALKISIHKEATKSAK